MRYVIERVCKMAEAFNELIRRANVRRMRSLYGDGVINKNAALRENMAKRIFYSLLAKLVDPAESFRVSMTKGAVDYNMLESLVTGAKELVYYGTKACDEEIKHYKEYDDMGVPRKQDLLQMYRYTPGKDRETALKNMVEMFGDLENWNQSYGGRAWQKIAQTLLALHNILKNISILKERIKEQGISNDQRNVIWEEYFDALREMTAYVNVLDGLAHNTGSIYTYLLSLQEKEEGEPFKLESLQRLMDTKEFEKEDDVLAEIMPLLENTNYAKQYKYWFDRARKRMKEYKGTTQYRDYLIKQIRRKKYRMAELERLTPFFGKVKERLSNILLSPNEKEFAELLKISRDMLLDLQYIFEDSTSWWGSRPSSLYDSRFFYSKGTGVFDLGRTAILKLDGLMYDNSFYTGFIKEASTYIKDILKVLNSIDELHDEASSASSATYPNEWQPKSHSVIPSPITAPYLANDEYSIENVLKSQQTPVIPEVKTPQDKIIQQAPPQTSKQLNDEDFAVVVKSYPKEKRVFVVKTVVDILGASVKDAVKFVDNLPSAITSQKLGLMKLPKFDADEIANQFRNVGAIAVVQPFQPSL